MNPLAMNLVSILALIGIPVVIILIGMLVGRMVSSSSTASAEPRSELRVVSRSDVDRAA